VASVSGKVVQDIKLNLRDGQITTWSHQYQKRWKLYQETYFASLGGLTSVASSSSLENMGFLSGLQLLA